MRPVVLTELLFPVPLSVQVSLAEAALEHQRQQRRQRPSVRPKGPPFLQVAVLKDEHETPQVSRLPEGPSAYWGLNLFAPHARMRDLTVFCAWW